MNSFQELRDSIVTNEYRREYSKGGLTIHRGFYSPSCVWDAMAIQIRC